MKATTFKQRKQAEFEQWQAVKPDGLAADNGDAWTGEVEMIDQTLWFFYAHTNGNVYMSAEKPALRIDLRNMQYVCVPESKAHLGLNNQVN